MDSSFPARVKRRMKWMNFPNVHDRPGLVRFALRVGLHPNSEVEGERTRPGCGFPRLAENTGRIEMLQTSVSSHTQETGREARPATPGRVCSPASEFGLNPEEKRGDGHRLALRQAGRHAAISSNAATPDSTSEFGPVAPTPVWLRSFGVCRQEQGKPGAGHQLRRGPEYLPGRHVKAGFFGKFYFKIHLVNLPGESFRGVSCVR